MEHSYSGGSWVTIPNNLSQNISPISANQDHSLHHLQQQQQSQQQQQQQLLLLHQQQNQQRQHQQLQQQQQNQQHQSLASHFHLKHLVENLSDAIENGSRDQHSDLLVNELTSNFEKCQQLLNSISGSISSKAMTVEGQRHKLEETEQLLTQRRDVIAKYRSSVEDLIKSNP